MSLLKNLITALFGVNFKFWHLFAEYFGASFIHAEAGQSIEDNKLLLSIATRLHVKFTTLGKLLHAQSDRLADSKRHLILQALLLLNHSIDHADVLRE